MPEYKDIMGGQSFEFTATLPEDVTMVAIRGLNLRYGNVPSMTWGDDKHVIRADQVRNMTVRLTGVQFVHRGGKVEVVPWSRDFRPEK